MEEEVKEDMEELAPVVYNQLSDLFSYKDNYDGGYDYTCNKCGEMINDGPYTRAYKLLRHSCYADSKLGYPLSNIRNYSSGYVKEHFGNKANGLKQLITQAFPVPETWCLPMELTFTRPKIEKLALRGNTHDKFAVRSGSSISMPGMMDTLLNVPYEGLDDAIKAVWDSWNSPRAIAYREAKGIPHDIGTGVIVQLMVEPKWSGVAFTNSPDNLVRTEYKPIVEYVDGYGTHLVDGSATPKTLDLNDGSFDSDKTNLVEKLSKYLKRIHSLWGPSDVEWVYSGITGLAFVQVRDLKFNTVIPEFDDTTSRKLIAIGTPLGAGKSVVGKLFNGSMRQKGKIFYARDFNPETTENMIHSDGILTKFGGKTCHAAIVAREFGKPAIGNITEKVYEKNRMTVVHIDGSTGKISEPTSEELEAYNKSLLDNQPVTAEDPAVIHEDRKPNFDLIRVSDPYKTTELFERFYGTLEAFNQGLIPESQRDAVIREVADVLDIYLFMATIGESRHLNRHAEGPITSSIKAGMDKFGLKNFATPTEGRSHFVIHNLTPPKDVATALGLSKMVHKGFLELRWPSGYGGAKWATITQVLIDYLSGKTSPILFADACFNLQHNGGSVFGKFTWISGNGGLAVKLDERRSIGFKSRIFKPDLISSHKATTPSDFYDREGDGAYIYRKWLQEINSSSPTVPVPILSSQPLADSGFGDVLDKLMVSTSLGTLNPKEQSPSWKDQPSSFKISVDTANLPVEEPKPTTEPKKKGYKKPSVQPYGSIKKEKRPAA